MKSEGKVTTVQRIANSRSIVGQALRLPGKRRACPTI